MLHTASHLKEREQGNVCHNPLQGPFPKSKNVSKFPLTFQHFENILTHNHWTSRDTEISEIKNHKNAQHTTRHKCSRPTYYRLHLNWKR